MRLCTYAQAGAARLGAQTPAGIVDLAALEPRLPATMRALLAGGQAALALARAALERADAGKRPGARGA